MKFLIICLVIFFVILLCGSWFIATRAELVAVGSVDGNFKFWKRLSAKEKEHILEVYQGIKHKLPETLNRRVKARGWGSNEFSTAKIYIIKDKQWIYFFADNYPFKAPAVEVMGSRAVNSIHYYLKTKKYKLE